LGQSADLADFFINALIESPLLIPMTRFDSACRVTVLGSGAWGSTLAKLALENGHSVTLWGRRSKISLDQAVAGADVIVSALSMQGVGEIAAQFQHIAIQAEACLVTATKGLDPASRDRPILPSQIWQRALPQHAIAVLSGPNLSKEIDQGLPAATVIASTHETAALQVQQVFSSSRFRVYTNPDPLGVELGGTLKNVIAIAVGACDGLQLGTNAKSALITRGLAEMIRIGTHWGGDGETFYGLSGVGDLLATCSSALSRNYQVGHGLAHGKSLATVLANLQGTAEGINTTQVLVNVAQQQGISLPISEKVNELLRAEITPQAGLAALMQRDSTSEM
jgi:glycerol-3-phosphate dehydrogenase (NAD(P)+)